MKMLMNMMNMIKKTTRKVIAMSSITLGVVSKSSSKGAKDEQNLGPREYYGRIWLVWRHGQVRYIDDKYGDIGDTDDIDESDNKYGDRFIKMTCNS